MKNSLFKQPNPLIDDCSAETLANVQAMLARIQILRVDRTKETALFAEHNPNSNVSCPGNELYVRLLMLVKEALDYEISKIKQN